MKIKLLHLIPVLLALFCNSLQAQVVINEGSNRNYSSIADENGEYPDWIELYNAGGQTVSLYNYSLTDDSLQPAKWTFPNVSIHPGEYLTVFCSGKDRKPVTGFINVLNTGTFVPHAGWNVHSFSTPFYWDGISNVLVNTCSYSSTGYTTNSVFFQSPTTYYSTSYNFQDGSEASCSATYGTRVSQRPNMKFNGHVVGTGQIQNSPYDYPAPYGNWYWGARHQMLIRAAELTAAGLPIGNLTSIAFNVASTDPTTYDYIDISLKLVTVDEISGEFTPVDTNNFLHTNFKIAKSGETIYLYSASQMLVSQLDVDCKDLDNSSGRHPDGSSGIYLFQLATPSATNNQSNTYSEYLLKPVFSQPSGIYEGTVELSMTNPNPGASSIHYTLDGSDPTPLSPTYGDNPLELQYSVVLKARAFAWGFLPSPITTSSYLFGVSHTTPVLSVITDQVNLYGEKGIFDNWWTDWEKAAYVEYFDSTQNLIFSQKTGMQMDGGWGGARSNPQHSFRLEMDDGVLGGGHVDYKIIPGRPERTKYSRIYLRNGSNQYLVFPYKDACETTAMGSGLNNYYSAWRPVSVYINGYYHGLYELREKFDEEYFETMEGADNNQMDILTLSAWYSYVLRATVGSTDGFYEDYAAFAALDPADTNYWKMADDYFDLTYYTDYVIGESWIANSDWPYNNIKIYRSDKTNFRWRFCLVDLELSLAPNSWTDCYFDHIRFMLDYDPNNPFINIWKRSIQNDEYRYYFINRFADVMNTAYRYENISAIENRMFDLTVPEMPKEYARWADPNHIPEWMAGFVDNHNIFLGQLAERTTQVRNHIQSNFSLPNQVDLTLNVIPEGGGKIHISTIMPDTYPWQGVYFNGIPIKIEAIPADGYNFLYWGNNGLIPDTLNTVWLGQLNTNSISFDAYFEEIATGITGVDEPGSISVYPNPAKDVLYVKNTENTNVRYEVIDVNGKICLAGALSGKSSASEINIISLQNSVYLLKLITSEGTVKQSRFIKIGN